MGGCITSTSGFFGIYARAFVLRLPQSSARAFAASATSSEALVSAVSRNYAHIMTHSTDELHKPSWISFKVADDLWKARYELHELLVKVEVVNAIVIVAANLLDH